MISLGAIEEKISKILGDNSVDFIAVASEDEKGENSFINFQYNFRIQRCFKTKIIKGFDNKLMIPEIIKLLMKFQN